MEGLRRCPLCDADAADALLEAPIEAEPPWRLARCPRCGFVFLQNPPDYAALAHDFAWDKTFFEERERRLRRQSPVEKILRRGLAAIGRLARALMRRNKLKTLCARYLRGGRVLDLGCSRGWNAESLPDDVLPLGIEISPALAAEAENRFGPRGGRVIRAPVLEGLGQLPDGSCRGAIAKSYLEHEIRPREVLAELGRVLEADAPVILKVPNYASWLRLARRARWSGYRFPDHVNYFTPASLTRMLEEAGLEVERFGLRDRPVTSDNMWCVARKRPRPAEER